MMHKKIEVVSYNPAWPQMFEAEAAYIRQALGTNCAAIHHVGSTAVPGLCAKPKIDIITVVKDMAHSIQNLEKIDYEYRGEFNIPLHLGFRKRPPLTNVNLHVFEEGNPEIELNLLFRNYLREHPEALAEYAALKLTLAGHDTSHEVIHGPFKGYTLGKDTFIKKILNQAGFKGLCMRFCIHYEEWEAARTFRQKYFFDQVPVEDPYTWTFDHQTISIWSCTRALKLLAIPITSYGQGIELPYG